MRTELGSRKELRGWSAITPKANTTWLTAAILKIDMTSYFRSGCSDFDEIRSRMQQNDTPITAKWSRSKPEVEFQYGGRMFFKTESTYISAVKWDISTKVGLLIYLDILKTLTSTNTKPEVVLSDRVRHFEKSIWRHISALGGPIWMKFGNFMQHIMRITMMLSKSKPEEYGGSLFLQNGNSYISAVDTVILAIYGMLIDIDLLKKSDFTNSDTEVKLRHNGRHLKNR